MDKNVASAKYDKIYKKALKSYNGKNIIIVARIALNK